MTVDARFTIHDDVSRSDVGEVVGPLPDVGDRLSVLGTDGETKRSWITAYTIIYCGKTIVHVVPFRAARTLRYKVQKKKG